MNARKSLDLSLVCLLLLSAAPASAVTLPPNFTSIPVVSTGLTGPTAMQFAPDGRLFILQQGGQVRIVENGTLLTTPFVSVTTVSNNANGLFGIAFDPDFSTNGFVYLNYSVGTTSLPNMRVTRYTAQTANRNLAVPGSAVTIFDMPAAVATLGHNAGAIHFWGDKLYIATGDQGTDGSTQGKDNAQTLANLFGKILRINKDGSIPTDNPFWHTAPAPAANKAIWALGLRNPYSFAFQPGTGRLFINNNGAVTWEEIEDGIPGANYGWPAMEGPDGINSPSYTAPFWAYHHTTGTTPIGRSVVGGSFYNPATVVFPQEYVGMYFFSDYVNGWVWRINPQTKARVEFATGFSSPIDNKVGPDGALYVLTRGTPTELVKIQYTGASAPLASIVTTDGNAAEPGTDLGRIQVSLNPAPVAAVTVNVTIAGTAANGVDYQTIPTTVLVPAGVSTAEIVVRPIDDSALEFPETVEISLAVGSGYTVGTSTAAVVTVADDDNQAPAASILTPVPGTLYAVGDVINYSGSAIDIEDGDLPASAFTWQVDFHHDAHHHPFLPATSGSRTGSFTVPPEGVTSENVWYRIYLTVVDAHGKTHQVFREVFPGRPVITSPASASPNPVTGTTSGLSVTATDDGGEPALVYTWSSSGPAAVTFTANGTNAAKNTTAQFGASGSYTLTVAVREASGYATTSSVGVTVVPTVTTIAVSPSTASVAAAGTRAFTATATDQFGLPVSTSFTWSVSGGGTISASGLFTAGSTPGGPFTVTASSSGRSGTASVTVTAAGLPAPWLTQDVGSVGVAGSATASGGTFTVKGSGADIWGTTDGFRFVHRQMSGNMEIIARVVTLQNTNNYAKAGVMIRETLSANSKNASMVLRPTGGARFQRRTSTGGSTSESGGSTVSAPYWVRLVRTGNTITGYRSSNGTTWTQASSATVTMTSTVYIGLALTSHANTVLNTSTFDNVTVIQR